MNEQLRKDDFMKAVIMAGGEGTRLRPLTCNRPKPMVPIVNRPVMEHIVDLLKMHKIKDIAVTLQYMPELIKEHFDTGEEFDVNMQYYVEESPLGTAGSVKNAEEFLNDTFIVISGDALTDINLTKAVQFHKKKGSIATLILKRVDVPLEYGVVVTNEEGKIVRFLEKPSWGEVFSDTVNTGIYILSPEVLKYFDKNKVFDFSKDLFPILLKQNKPMYGYITDEYWCDIGDLEAYRQANMDALEGIVQVNFGGKKVAPQVWIGENTYISPKAIINGPAILGNNCIIKENVRISDFTIIDDGNTISEESSVKRSVIWKNCMVDKKVQIRGSVVCSKVSVGTGAAIFENSVIGEGTRLCENTVVKPSVKIWPGKVVEVGTEVNSSLIWGSRYSKVIFGNRGISGETNLDMTPEFASRLGAAFGSFLKNKAAVAIGCDQALETGMMKFAFIAGLQSSGIEVMDAGILLLPAIRAAVRFYGADGGIYLSMNEHDSQKVNIEFLNKSGANIDRGSERKIENIFAREDFSRCEGCSVMQIKNISSFTDFHVMNLINRMKSSKLNHRILVCPEKSLSSDTLSEVLRKIGCVIDRCSSKEFSEMVSAFNYDMSVKISNNAEKVQIADDKGRIVSEDLFLAIIALISFSQESGSTLVAPLSASKILETMAKQYKGKVVRSKTSIQDVMAKIYESSINSSVSTPNQFSMQFDAMAAVAMILEHININGMTLSELVNSVPQFYMNSMEVECPWNAKGKVIRQLMQEHVNDNVETLEGVKVYKDNGWVLVLPDAEKPICRVISEGANYEFAQELTDIYADKIRKISGSKA